jgi:hypothetical protein
MFARMFFVAIAYLSVSAGADQLADYRAPKPKTALELQMFRRSTPLAMGGEWIEINPQINAWYILRIGDAVYHLENADPQHLHIGPDSSFVEGLIVAEGARKTPCPLWGGDGALEQARASGLPFTPLCGGKLFLRNPTAGHKTSKEWATDFLRRHVWGGEQITNLVRQTVYADAFLLPAEQIAAQGQHARVAGAPAPLLLDSELAAALLTPTSLGLELQGSEEGRVRAGRWYPLVAHRGIFVSALQPGMVAAEIVEAQRGQIKAPDEVELKALVYLVAFDLGNFDLGFALGTEHPSLLWSERVLPQIRVESLPGPDGIGEIAPLIATGLPNPQIAARTVATFTGGFKRYHGAFKYGDLAKINSGSHYGFIEHGAVLSKLQPGLATALVMDDGEVDLRTWTEGDEALLGRVRHARQNGVALVETDAAGQIRPGRLVGNSAGNWSGAVDGRYRTLRAGMCLQEWDGRHFLIYGYFSSATSGAMARVFAAGQCGYAMHLDMNALEHTYLAVYRRRDQDLQIEHLVSGMEVLDKKSGEQVVPRFVGYADNRDFFYLMRKDAP